ncbi:nuclear transport factor 2 family protein [Marinimicrobium alkaliphilum]|uniref:nuclear transport factor 2 family protein n=1 Tax=Marinimicrobium alkaliphilum TaxID=2202654 RepID=UPI0013002372|nr:nuclear transport factor 2 family protein [Marinimicrobium alkaliphilum]
MTLPETGIDLTETSPAAALRALYQRFEPAILPELARLYREDITFIDPVHALKGRAALEAYFAEMMNGLEHCQFEFHDQLESVSGDRQGQAVLTWTMHYRYPKLAGGQALTLEGNSHIRFDDGIYYHRDYYDLGAMFYEQLPVIGRVVKQLKKRLESQ